MQKMLAWQRTSFKIIRFWTQAWERAVRQGVSSHAFEDDGMETCQPPHFEDAVMETCQPISEKMLSWRRASLLQKVAFQSSPFDEHLILNVHSFNSNVFCQI